jgi:hypothetical protein
MLAGCFAGGSLRGLPLLWNLKQRTHSALKVFGCFRAFFVFCFWFHVLHRENNTEHMPEDDDSPTKNNSANKPLALSHKENPITGEGNPGSESREGNPRPHWADRIVAIFTGLIFLTYIASNYFSCNQLKLTKAAIDQSATNNASAIAAQQKIAQDGLAKSQENFDKSISSARDQLRLDQRAWLGVDNVIGQAKVGEIFTVTVYIKNTGKTPAKNVFIISDAMPVPKGSKPTFGYEKAPITEESRAMIAPNSIHKITSLRPQAPMDEPTLDSLKRRDIIQYMYGKGTYTDVFGCVHWFTYCYYLLTDAQNWGDCSKYNDTGDYPCQQTASLPH